MAVTTALTSVKTRGDKKVVRGTITGDSSYPLNGEDLAPSAIGLGDELAYLRFEDNGSYGARYDYAAENVIFLNKPEGGQNVNVEDDDSAASAGVAVYVHVDEVFEQGNPVAHLEFVSPTNADGSGTIASGGATYYVQDDDNAGTGGVALYVDEDAANPDERFLANCGRDVVVLLSNGEMLKIKHNATPATPGVQVYFDEDAASAHQRLRFVSPTNTDAVVETAREVSSRRAGSEVAAATDLSGVVLRFEAEGQGVAAA